MKILAIGDVVGPAAIEYLSERLWKMRDKFALDLIAVNGENASIGNGLSRADAEALLAAGADVITTGNHVWQKFDLRDYLDDSPYIVRPANYPAANPGSGSTIIDAAGRRVLVMNVAGVVYGEPLADPFEAVEHMLKYNEGRYDLSVLDIHAETTSEKMALARYFDGRINVIWGTHTHVQTSDAQILPGGTAFITDLGMTGPKDSILGVKSELIIRKLRTHMPVKFEIAGGEVRGEGAIFTLDGSFKAVSAEAIRF